MRPTLRTHPLAETVERPQRPVAFVFTQQTIGLGNRKTSLVFMAEALAAKGYDVHVVTTQLSWLSRLRAASRLGTVPAELRNRWYEYEGMRAFVWVPAVHPISARGRLAAAITAPLVSLYGHLLPKAIRSSLARAELVLVESCAAVALFRQIKQAARAATVIYSMSDRLDAVGMHPLLQRRLLEDAPAYDLVRVPASSLLQDLPGARTVCIRHGLEKQLFDRTTFNPYDQPRNAVLVGDMRLDQATFRALVQAFPRVQFHYFGRTHLNFTGHANLIVHGEVPFEKLVPFVKHADVGLALYQPAASLNYLAESSLKLIQYRYCGLPIVAPDFLRHANPSITAYEHGVSGSAESALKQALNRERVADAPDDILTWAEVTDQMLTAAFAARSERASGATHG
jgi:2-beta-glucuronyltransferase